eukprot:scaffold5390_cov116-Isochrysis_galbana.AAC.13
MPAARNTTKLVQPPCSLCSPPDAHNAQSQAHPALPPRDHPALSLSTPSAVPIALARWGVVAAQLQTCGSLAAGIVEELHHWRDESDGHQAVYNSQVRGLLLLGLLRCHVGALHVLRAGVKGGESEAAWGEEDGKRLAGKMRAGRG